MRGPSGPGSPGSGCHRCVPQGETWTADCAHVGVDVQRGRAALYLAAALELVDSQVHPPAGEDAERLDRGLPLRPTARDRRTRTGKFQQAAVGAGLVAIDRPANDRQEGELPSLAAARLDRVRLPEPGRTAKKRGRPANEPRRQDGVCERLTRRPPVPARLDATERRRSRLRSRCPRAFALRPFRQTRSPQVAPAPTR